MWPLCYTWIGYRQANGSPRVLLSKGVDQRNCLQSQCQHSFVVDDSNLLFRNPFKISSVLVVIGSCWVRILTPFYPFGLQFPVFRFGAGTESRGHTCRWRFSPAFWRKYNRVPLDRSDTDYPFIRKETRFLSYHPARESSGSRGPSSLAGS